MSKFALSFASRVVVALVLVVGLAACGTSGGPGTGSVSGKLDTRVPIELASVQGSRELAETLSIHPKATFVEGEVLVKFRAPTNLRITAQGLGATVARDLGGGVHLLRTGNAAIGNSTQPATVDTGRGTLELVAELRARRDVVYAEPNYIYYAAQTEPTDAEYTNQWHYEVAKLPEAWDITTGSDSVVVAVLDTGILFDEAEPSASHPDFDPGRILPGYDFVDDDSNPYDEGPQYDPGDGCFTSFHGTHVAGTVGAWTSHTTVDGNANANEGVAGVDWHAGLVNVRVLGPCGGSVADIAGGIRWAAGLDVGIGLNTWPADVINMSLGGHGYSQTVQDAIDAATAEGAIIVVAAGNNADDARDYFPAGMNNVITVGATGRPTDTSSTGDLTWYSNYGPAIEIMAPGGEHVVDGDANGVLSTLVDSADGFGYAYYEGTSMASPHVAGIVALMEAANTVVDLDLEAATSYLRNTATPIATTACDTYGCGAGLVDAFAAVTAARDAGAIGAHLGTTFTIVDLGWTDTTGSFVIDNQGDAKLDWTVSTASSRVTPEHTSGSTAAGDAITVDFTVDRIDLPDGVYFATLEIEEVGGNNHGTVQISLVQGSGQSDLGPLHVYLFDLNTGDTKYVSPAALHDDLYAFRIDNIIPGVYGLEAADCDRTQSGCIPAHFGFYFGRVEVAAGQETSNILVDMDYSVDGLTDARPRVSE